MKVALLIFSLIFGFIGAVPFYGDFDSDAEFFPLARTQRPNLKEKPFDIDVITSEVGGDSSPSVFIQQSFPFFSNDFFNPFGGFGFGSGPRQVPWWKGPNVCIEKQQEVKDASPKESTNVAEQDANVEPTESVDVRPPVFAQFQFSLNSCVEKPNKHVCTKVLNHNGKKKSLTITHQCCRGYGRPRNADVATSCEKIEIKDIEETAADWGAKEFIKGAKSNGFNDLMANRKNITVFMPTDSAFSSFNEQMLNEKNLVESKSDDSMRNMFLRHIVPGEINLDDVANEQMLQTDLKGQSVRINAYQLPNALGAERFRYAANCVPIERHDKQTEQGIVHLLRNVMKPVTRNVMDMIRHRPDLSIMRTVLEKTKLNELLEGDGPVTFFVPTDMAFEKLDPQLRRSLKEGKGCAANILKNHILDLTFCSVASVSGTKTTTYNLLGEAMRFNRSSSPSTEKKAEDKDIDLDSQPIVINEMAKIVEADLMGTNGVIHVIDTVLPTSSALPLSMLMQEQNVTLFKRLLEAAGIADKFDDMDNVTVFAPTDKAVEGSKWAQILEESPDTLRNNAELLDIINYHVVSPLTKTCDLSEKLMPTESGDNQVRINLYSTHTLFSNVMNRATVNCARMVHFDNESCGSVLHQVDKVLTPPKKNLLELLMSDPTYSKFLELVQAANLTEHLSKPDASLTLLVPKNEVFKEVEDWEEALIKNQSQLVDLVKTHIVNDVICCAGIIPTHWPFVRTIESLNGAHLHITRDRRPKIENAGVTKCDKIAMNGIIHEINDIVVSKRLQRRPEPNPQQFPIGQFGDILF